MNKEMKFAENFIFLQKETFSHWLWNLFNFTNWFLFYLQNSAIGFQYFLLALQRESEPP